MNRENEALTGNHTNLASQARHEMGAQWSCSLTRNVVTNKRELGKDLKQEGTGKTEISRKRTQGSQKMGNSTGQPQAGSGHIRILVAIFVTERSLMFAYVRLKPGYCIEVESKLGSKTTLCLPNATQ